MVDTNDYEMANDRGNPSLKETATMLSRTPKGQIVYDRHPLTPDIEATFSNKSGVLLPEDILNQNTSVFEKPVDRSTVSLGLDLQNHERRNNQFKWQQELLLMRNTSQLDETTPVYNLSNHMIMQLFELKEAHRLSMASNLMKKIEELEESARQDADEECLRKKQELQERLIPKTDSSIDFEKSMKRLQDEALLKRKLKEDQIDQKLKEMQFLQEKEQQEELEKKTLKLKSLEANNRKEVCWEKIQRFLGNLGDSINTCLEKESFIHTIQSKIDRTSALKVQFETVKNAESAGDPLINAARCENITKQIEDLVEVIIQDIEKNNAAVQEKITLAKQRHTQPVVEPSTKLPTSLKANHEIPSQTVLPSNKSNQPNVSSSEKNTDFVNEEDLKLYQELQKELLQYEATTAAFTSDASLKTLRFDLQKAVVHPVNEISDQSGQHLLDKLDRLRKLLQGHPVNLGTKQVRATDHPGGLEYCTNLLARRMVQQGEDQVNVNPKAAFPIAAVIVELWLEFPMFGRLVLAHFYRQCPYLVPYYVPQQEGQSSEEYYRLLGYRYSGGKVEQQPAYLKRMSGIVRLYAAVMVSLPRRNQPHPYGLDQAWRYLAALLNLAPLPEITPTILVELISVAGHALAREYGKQFQKILHLICTDYFVMMRNVTPKGVGGGPITRLEEFLQESIKKGGIAPPAGQLPPRFW